MNRLEMLERAKELREKMSGAVKVVRNDAGEVVSEKAVFNMPLIDGVVADIEKGL